MLQDAVGSRWADHVVAITDPEKGTMRLEYDVPTGTYAVSVWHDEDDNGEFDRNERGMPLDGWAQVSMAIGFGYVAIVMSNLMSNTATANLLLPITIAVFQQTGGESRLAVPIALASSAAMCLPISTPPNAIVYGSGKISTVELIWAGLLIGIVTPPLVVGWCWLMLG